MKSVIRSFNFLFLFLFFLPFINLNAQNLTHYVLVSVAPYKFFVEKIAGNTVKVGLMVPPGASAHTYEPSPKEMLKASHADAWFLIGEPFEAKATQAIQSHHSTIQLVDLRQHVDLISSDPNHVHHHQCTHHNCLDLHIWLSPRQSKKQAITIAEALAKLYPENKSIYEKNLKEFLQQLDELDRYITTKLHPLKKRVIMVSHPAYAYFCRDYDLRQLSIEFEGKDPTPKQLTRVIDDARKNNIKKIFTQIQYSNKGARLIASHIGAEIVNLDPYAENYLESMKYIAETFSTQ